MGKFPDQQCCLKCHKARYLKMRKWVRILEDGPSGLDFRAYFRVA